MLPVLVFLLSTVLLLVGELESFGYATGSGVALTNFGLVPALGIAVVVLGARRGRPTVRACGVALLAAAFAAIVAGSATAKFQRRLSTQRGDALAQALEAFHAARGTFPKALAELVPAQVPTIGTAAFGLFHEVPFEYRLEGDDYVLGFEDVHFLHTWRGKDGRWITGE